MQVTPCPPALAFGAYKQRYIPAYESRPVWNENIAWQNLEKNPLRELARAKILRAIMDISYQGKDGESLSLKEKTRRWIFGKSDFEDWCFEADMTPDVVRKRALYVMERGLKWRAAAGESKRYLERKAYRKRMGR